MQTKEPKHINQGLGKTVQDQEPINRLLAGHYMSLYTAYLPFDLQRELYRIHEVGLLCNGAIKYVVLVLLGRFESEIVLEFLNLVL